ncbi:hypothetical protein [Tuwongella immobilis]|uniref:Uncharacterized protein n=1 Tax=Tuwongella immobilis TaxID=692036 RepID=A0A6C2YH18_9BACT|nr:hypothetical protein [Tuwongella immobilis]VIP00654.1 unnamed protein product [Tuwongella immobilis]VTR96726.1 unnamed protein product [Tuwongella immobilis]
MAKVIRVFSMSVLDLLCCALGGAILISFLLIASMSRPSIAGAKERFLTVSAGVWIDVTIPNVRIAPGSPQADAIAEAHEIELSIRHRSVSQAQTDARVPYSLKLPTLKVDSAVTSDDPLGISNGSPRLAQGQRRLTMFDSQARAHLRYEVVGIRTVGPRQYLAILVDAALSELAEGWYFFQLNRTKRPDATQTAEAWLRIDSSGWPGSARYQTQATFADAYWPDGAGMPLIRQELQVEAIQAKRPANSTRAQDQQRMNQLYWPDLWLPSWPNHYPLPQTPGPKSIRFRERTSFQTEANWVPTFVLTWVDDTALPPIARYPLADSARQPGLFRQLPAILDPRIGIGEGLILGAAGYARQLPAESDYLPGVWIGGYPPEPAPAPAPQAAPQSRAAK